MEKNGCVLRCLRLGWVDGRCRLFLLNIFENCHRKRLKIFRFLKWNNKIPRETNHFSAKSHLSFQSWEVRKMPIIFKKVCYMAPAKTKVWQSKYWNLLYVLFKKKKYSKSKTKNIYQFADNFVIQLK